MVWIIMSGPRSRRGGKQALNCFWVNTSFFSYFSMLSWEPPSRVDIGEGPPFSASNIPYLASVQPVILYTHSRGPMSSFLWPTFGWILAVSCMSCDTPWVTGSSRHNRGRVQQVYHCRHNKRAARRPPLLFYRGRGSREVSDGLRFARPP